MKRLGIILRRSKTSDPVSRAKMLESLAATEGGNGNALSKLIDGLSDKSPVVRVAAAEGLGHSAQFTALPYLVKALADVNPEVRMRAAESLAVIAKSGDSPVELVRSLRDHNELVRIAAAIALGEIGDVKALPALRRAISDRSPLVRRYACVSVAKFGDSQDIRRLKRGFKKETSDVAKLGYSHALFLFGQTEQLFEMLILLTSQNYRVRCATARSLAEITSNKFQRCLIAAAIRERYQAESTNAAKSSFQAALRQLTK